MTEPRTPPRYWRVPDAIVRAIRQSDEKPSVLAKRYGISRVTVWRVREDRR